MATPETTDQDTHDASSGFHDIKPLPDFSPISTAWLLPLALLMLLWAYRYWKKQARTPKAALPAPARDPLEVALERLSRLELQKTSGDISIRDFAVRLSLLLRAYWQEVLHFEATEQTVRELHKSLPVALSSTVSVASEAELLEFTSAASKVLKFCERAAFADDSDQVLSLHSREVSDSLQLARESVMTLSSWKTQSTLQQAKTDAQHSAVSNARRSG